MTIGIIGTGNMGKGLAKRAAGAGETVLIAGQDLDKTKGIARELGTSVKAVRIGDVASATDLVVVATPFSASVAAVRAAGGLADKVVVDISNPLTADFMAITIGHTTSAAEELQRSAPGARVVKAFNTVFAGLLASPKQKPAIAVYYAGDDEKANEAVRALIARLDFEPVFTGPLVTARYLEPLTGLMIQLAFVRGRGPVITPAFLNVAGG